MPRSLRARCPLRPPERSPAQPRAPRRYPHAGADDRRRLAHEWVVLISRRAFVLFLERAGAHGTPYSTELSGWADHSKVVARDTRGLGSPDRAIGAPFPTMQRLFSMFPRG